MIDVSRMFCQRGNTLSIEYLSPLDAAAIVVGTPQGVIRSISGVSAQELFSLIDQREFSSPTSHVLFVEATATTSAEALVEAILRGVAETALKVWPVWYKGSGIDFGICRKDALGRQAVAALAREVSKKCGRRPADLDRKGRVGRPSW